MFRMLPGSPPSEPADGHTCTSPMPSRSGPGCLVTAGRGRRSTRRAHPARRGAQCGWRTDPRGSRRRLPISGTIVCWDATSRSPSSADTVLLLFIARPILNRWVTECRCRLCTYEPRARLGESSSCDCDDFCLGTPAPLDEHRPLKLASVPGRLRPRRAGHMASIGYTVGAVQGTLLAAPERRHLQTGLRVIIRTVGELRAHCQPRTAVADKDHATQLLRPRPRNGGDRLWPLRPAALARRAALNQTGGGPPRLGPRCAGEPPSSVQDSNSCIRTVRGGSSGPERRDLVALRGRVFRANGFDGNSASS
jgi:hypothetical protein